MRRSAKGGSEKPAWQKYWNLAWKLVERKEDSMQRSQGETSRSRLGSQSALAQRWPLVLAAGRRSWSAA